MRSVYAHLVQLGNYNILRSSSVKYYRRYSTKMKILSFFLVSTLIVSFSAVPEVSARANQAGGNNAMTTNPNSSPFKVCIDDSDCQKIKQGDTYACFQYLCYPWKDESGVPEKDKIPLCRKTKDCKDGKTCVRHHNRRKVTQGLCMDEEQECGLDSDNDCPKDKGCCGSYCCENKYHRQYKELPCTNHIGCEDLGLGKFCCPRNGQESVCCAIDPNPPKPTPNTVKDSNGGAATFAHVSAFTSSIISTMFFFWLMWVDDRNLSQAAHIKIENLANIFGLG